MHNKEYRIFKKVLLHIALLIVVLISIFPFTLEIRFAGGFMVVISTVAGTISGYLINPETEITSKRKTKKMVIPHLNIHVGR